MLLGAHTLALNQVSVLLLHLIVLLLDALPELGVMRITLPLLSELLDVILEQVAMIILVLQDALRDVLPLDARLGAENARKVRNRLDNRRSGSFLQVLAPGPNLAH